MKRKVFLFIVVALILWLATTTTTWTQEWSEPANVSKTLWNSSNMQMVVDNKDTVHFIWRECTTPRVIDGEFNEQPSRNELFYSYKETASPWSKPRSLFKTRAPRASQFRLTMDRKDTLYLIWQEHSHRSRNEKDQLCFSSDLIYGKYPKGRRDERGWICFELSDVPTSMYKDFERTVVDDKGTSASANQLSKGLAVAPC